MPHAQHDDAIHITDPNDTDRTLCKGSTDWLRTVEIDDPDPDFASGCWTCLGVKEHLRSTAVRVSAPGAARSPEVIWDESRELATFQGPGGFTQIPMPENSAKAVATALGVDYRRES